jgi:hypothetical protein
MRIVTGVLAACLLCLHPAPWASAAPPDAGQPGVEEAARWVADRFRPQEGFVVTISDRSVFTSLGAATSLPLGAELSVVRDGEPILHPLTRQVLGRHEVQVGVLVVSKVSAEYASGEVWPEPGQEVRVGDRVRISALPHRLAVIPPGAGGQATDWFRSLAGALARQTAVVPAEVDATLRETPDATEVTALASRHSAGAVLRVLDSPGREKGVRLELYSSRTGRQMGALETGPAGR